MIYITSQLSQIAQKLQIMRRPPCRRDRRRTAHLSRNSAKHSHALCREQTFPNWRAALIDTHPKTSLIATGALPRVHGIDIQDLTHVRTSARRTLLCFHSFSLGVLEAAPDSTRINPSH